MREDIDALIHAIDRGDPMPTPRGSQAQPFVLMLGCLVGTSGVESRYAMAPVVVPRYADRTEISEIPCPTCKQPVTLEVIGSNKAGRTRLLGAFGAVAFLILFLYVFQVAPPVPPGGTRDSGWVFLLLVTAVAALVALLVGSILLFQNEVSLAVTLKETGTKHIVAPAPDRN